MQRRVLAATLTLVGASALSAYAFGGWALVSLDEVPTHLQVGTPTQLSFMVRQHGVEPLTGLQPTIEARTGGMIGGTTVEAKAVPGKKQGQYTAVITIPKTGEWKLTIRSGFGPSNLTLLPLQATDGKTTVASISESERGKQVFVAKGCLTCHVNERAPGEKGMVSDYGPSLTDKSYDPAFLAMWLENPRIKPPTTAGKEMPNLGLSKREITSLVAFINNGKTAAAKQH
jgi:mono/diheme cytochrome c family protein